MENEERHKLVEAARRGDAAALEGLIVAYQPRVAGFIYTFLGESQVIEDLAQQIFIQMVNGIAKLKEPERFEAWLFRMARNACISHTRKRRWLGRFVPFQPHHEAAAPEEDDRTEEQALWLRRAVIRLPEAQRELLALMQDERMSYADLAQVTGRTIGSIKTALFRARTQLKEWREHEFQ